jgi:hypothetical protein
MKPPDYATLQERLEAAAISLKMMAAKEPGGVPMVATMARRFGVDESALRGVFQSHATQLTYDRIHSNHWPEVDL